MFPYFTSKKTKNAVIVKSISVAITFPYKIHLKESCSIFFTLSFVRIGFKIIGVIKSSINPLISSQTLVATNNQIAIPTILYCAKN
jgi:hypothetical protein